MDWVIVGLTVLIILGILLVTGTPIGFALGTTSMLGMLIFLGPSALNAMSNITWGAVNDFIITAVPLFILMSEVIVLSGIGRDLYIAAERWLSGLPGGLAVATVVTSAMFGAVSGTAVGVAAVVGSMAIPEMLKRGYNTNITVGSVSGASGLGVIIPPSLPLILYGVVTETSVGKLFVAGILPGIMLTILFSIYVVFGSWRFNKHREVKTKTFTFREKMTSLIKVLPIVILIIVVIGGIYTGIMTPTESAGMGAVVSMIIAFMYRQLTWKNLWGALVNTAKTSSMLVIILISAMLFSYLLSAVQIPQLLSSWIISLDVNKWVIIAILMIFFIVMGMFLDGTSIILLSVPITFPIITSLGFDPYWFAIMLMITICTATITPPVGLSSYVVKNIVPEVPLGTIFKSAIPYIVINVIALVILAIFPEIVLFLLD